MGLQGCVPRELRGSADKEVSELGLTEGDFAMIGSTPVDVTDVSVLTSTVLEPQSCETLRGYAGLTLILYKKEGERRVAGVRGARADRTASCGARTRAGRAAV